MDQCKSHVSKHVKLKWDIGLGITQDGALVIYGKSAQGSPINLVVNLM